MNENEDIFCTSKKILLCVMKRISFDCDIRFNHCNFADIFLKFFINVHEDVQDVLQKLYKISSKLNTSFRITFLLN